MKRKKQEKAGRRRGAALKGSFEEKTLKKQELQGVHQSEGVASAKALRPDRF